MLQLESTVLANIRSFIVNSFFNEKYCGFSELQIVLSIVFNLVKNEPITDEKVLESIQTESLF